MISRGHPRPTSVAVSLHKHVWARYMKASPRQPASVCPHAERPTLPKGPIFLHDGRLGCSLCVFKLSPRTCATFLAPFVTPTLYGPNPLLSFDLVTPDFSFCPRNRKSRLSTSSSRCPPSSSFVSWLDEKRDARLPILNCCLSFFWGYCLAQSGENLGFQRAECRILCPLAAASG